MIRTRKIPKAVFVRRILLRSLVSPLLASESAFEFHSPRSRRAVAGATGIGRGRRIQRTSP